jgi:ABC-type anion transport system duplicated permease subunit
MKHFPLRELGYAVGILAVLAALYAGSYYAMVTRIEMTIEPGGHVLDAFPAYRFWPQASGVVFSPIYQMDRHLRPEYWHEPFAKSVRKQ